MSVFDPLSEPPTGPDGDPQGLGQSFKKLFLNIALFLTFSELTWTAA
jgi:hypothetical protein